MGTHNICLYKEVVKKYTGCILKNMELLDCALIGVCQVIRSNTVYMYFEVYSQHTVFTLSNGAPYLLTILVLKFETVHSTLLDVYKILLCIWWCSP